jgi:hypothetical protein
MTDGTLQQKNNPRHHPRSMLLKANFPSAKEARTDSQEERSLAKMRDQQLTKHGVLKKIK